VFKTRGRDGASPEDGEESEAVKTGENRISA
jgi:hypothetical protein